MEAPLTTYDAEELPKAFRALLKTQRPTHKIFRNLDALQASLRKPPTTSLIERCRRLAEKTEALGALDAASGLERLDSEAHALSYARRWSRYLDAAERRTPADEPSSPSLPSWPALLRPAYLTFDTLRFDFRALLLRIFAGCLAEPLEPGGESVLDAAAGAGAWKLGSLEEGPFGRRRALASDTGARDPLALLHATPAGQRELGYAQPATLRPELERARADGGDGARRALDDATRYGCNVFNKTLKASAHYDEFLELYRTFVRDVVAPALGCRELLYQSRPIFRAFLPGHLAVGPRHRDSAYHEAPNEVNLWLPLTDCFDTNSLQVESAAGVGDFCPITCGYGTVYRFHGNSCEHLSELNLTGRTRLSLDFRVIRATELTMRPVPEAPPPSSADGRTPSRKATVNFCVGSYYERLLVPSDR